MNLSDRIKAARAHAKLTQEELAKLVGMTQQGVQKLESGKNKSTALAVQIADACGVSVHWLAKNEGAMLHDAGKGSKSWQEPLKTPGFVGESQPPFSKNTTPSTTPSVQMLDSLQVDARTMLDLYLALPRDKQFQALRLMIALQAENGSRP